MYKKLLFSLVLMAIGFMSSYAQETLTVYDGGATNAYVPVYGFYADAYSKVEFIMNSDELSPMTGGTITGLKWYLSSPAEVAWGGVFQIFVKEVEQNTLDNYIGPENATIVYEGPLDGTQEVLKITFATPYEYNGGNLLVGVYGIEKGTYKSATFSGAEVIGAAVQGYSYSSLDACSLYLRDFVPMTTFSFEPAGGVVYYKPTNVHATDLTPNSAVIAWNPGSNEGAWNVEYRVKGTEEWIAAGSVTEPTITLDVLENGTPYEVRVQADYGDGNLSGWANGSFATPACDEADMGEVEYVLTDSYGDGWNNNHLKIFIAGTDVLIADLFIPGQVNGTPNDNYAEGIVNLCYGVDYDLVWVAGSYPYETGFTLTAPDGSIIYEFQGTGSSGPVPTPGVLTTFQINRVTCPRPTDLTATNVVYNGATLAWTPGAEEQDLWQVACGVGEYDPNTVEPITVNGEPTTQLTGLAENTTYTVYVRSVCTAEDMSIWSKPCTFTTPLQFPLVTDLEIGKITAKSAEATWNGEAEAYNLRYRAKTNLDESFENEVTGMQFVDANGDGLDWQILHITEWNMGGTPLVAADGEYCIVSESVTIEGSNPVVGDNWLISSKVNLGGTLSVSAADLGANYVENFSVLVSTTDTNFDSFTEVGTATTPGVLNQWGTYEFDLSAYAGQEGYIAIRHQPNGATGYILMIDAVSIEGVSGAEWTVLENVTSPVTMEPLAAGTTYEVEVQGIFEDGVSGWVSTQFTTLPADAMPSDLEVVNVTATTAQANWAGSQETYNLRYRTAAVYNGITEDFTGYETGDVPTGWTVIDADGDGQNWYVWNLTLDDGTVQTTLSSNSYINNYGALTPDNWIITPQVKLGASVMFDAWGQDPSYAAEHFQVYVSTTGTDVADFTPISDEIVATGVQTNYSFDLGENAGQMGYIAIRHFNITDMYILNVTNFYMAGESDDVPAGEWVVVENVTAPYVIEGLTPETAYEVEVQGVVADGTTTNWTAPVNFVTLQGGGEEPTEYCARPECAYAITDFETVTVTITNNEPEATVVYSVYCGDELIEEGTFTGDQYQIVVTGPGDYVVHAVATMPGYLDSPDGGVFFTILPNDVPPVSIDELVNGKTVAGVRYFNALGQEVNEINGMTIVVTTYTDGTTSTAKVMK